MKAFNQLTRRGRIRRLRKLAVEALKQYDIGEASLTFQHYEGNLVFRTDTTGPALPDPEGWFVPNRYNLRVLTTCDESIIPSELTWLKALRTEAGILVPEPVETMIGELYTRTEIPGVPGGRFVSLMRWIDGRSISRGLTEANFIAWGKAMAQLHTFAAAWQPPKDFNRPDWDWEGQLNGRTFRTPVEEIILRIPEKYADAFHEVSATVKAVTEKLGQGREAYGMIHADMYPENLLFKAGKAIPIDFEDCGFGYFIWDIAIALCSWPWIDGFEWRREAFLEGYLAERNLPEEQLKHLDLFMATQYATMVLWATLFIVQDPARANKHAAWRDADGEKLLKFFDR